MTQRTSYDDVAAGYDDHYATRRDKAEDRWVERKLGELLDRYVVGHTRMLDLGCGSGKASELAYGCGRVLGQYDGMDPSRAMLDRCYAQAIHRTLGSVQLHEGSFDDDEVWEPVGLRSPFNLITAFWSLQYSRDYMRVMRIAESMLTASYAFMFITYTPRYLYDDDYIVKGSTHLTVDNLPFAVELETVAQKCFPGADVSVCGLSNLNHLVPGWMPQGVHNFLTAAETRSKKPDRCRFLVTYGGRRHG